MKITIDTQVDTYEDIKKILNILNGIIEKKDNIEAVINSTPEQTQNAEAGFMNMFGDDSNSSSTPIQNSTPTKDTAPNFNSFLNLLNKPEKKEMNGNKLELEYY